MSLLVVFFYVFFFKQKTAYEMRISDWSSDVCSSDLDLPTALLRDMVYGATEHHSWNYVCGRGALDIDTLADQITSILCDGISRAGGKLEGRRRLSKRAAHLESQFEKRIPRNRRDRKSTRLNSSH